MIKPWPFTWLYEADPPANVIEINGVRLTGPPWTVDGEPMRDVRQAVETLMARLYPNNAELSREFIQYQRRLSGIMLCSPQTMVRRARDRAGMTLTQLSAASGVDRQTIWRIESGKSDPKASTLFAIMHAVDSRR